MNEFIKQNWFRLGILIILTLGIGANFYWYALRPSIIKKYCSNKARGSAIEKLGREDKKFSESDYDAYLKFCLKDKGL